MLLFVLLNKQNGLRNEKFLMQTGWTCRVRMKKAARRRLVQLLEIFDLLFDGAAGPTLVSVFALGFLNWLPLHVAVMVGAAGAERGDVIDHEARARAVRFRRVVTTPCFDVPPRNGVVIDPLAKSGAADF